MIDVHPPPTPAVAAREPVREALEDPATRLKIVIGIRVCLSRWMRYASRTERDQNAEDMASEAMVMALAKASAYDPAKASVSTWIIGFARNLVRRHCFRAKKESGVRRQDSDVDPAVSVQDALIKKAEREQVGLSLARLAPIDQRIARAFYFEEMPGADIAAQVGITAINVRVRLCRIRKELSQMLSPALVGGSP